MKFVTLVWQKPAGTAGMVQALYFAGFSQTLWLQPCSSLGVHVKLVPSPNYWVLTQMV